MRVYSFSIEEREGERERERERERGRVCARECNGVIHTITSSLRVR